MQNTVRNWRRKRNQLPAEEMIFPCVIYNHKIARNLNTSSVKVVKLRIHHLKTTEFQELFPGCMVYMLVYPGHKPTNIAQSASGTRISFILCAPASPTKSTKKNSYRGLDLVVMLFQRRSYEGNDQNLQAKTFADSHFQRITFTYILHLV